MTLTHANRPALTVPANLLRSRWHRFTIATALLGLAACGGGDDAPTEGGTPPVASPAPAPAPAPAPSPGPAPAPAPAPSPALLPTITTPLPATLTLAEGETGTLTVAASSGDGSALSYRWLRNGGEYPVEGNGTLATVPSALFLTSYPAESWQVEVRNAAGAVMSSPTSVVRRSRTWAGAVTAHTDHDAALGDAPAQPVSIVDPAGRVHVLSVQQRAGGQVVAFKGHSRDSDTDAWGYETTLPAASAQARVSHLSVSATWMGEMVAAWLETTPLAGGGERSVVRAVMYRPAASAATAGSWSAIGTVSDSESPASEPTVVNVGAGAFGVAWLQRGGPTQPRSAVLRRYDVPAAGEPAANGLGSVFEMETLAADISRLQVLGEGGHPVAFMYLESAGKWQVSRGPGGTEWSAPVDLAVDHRFDRIHWATPVNGLTLLAVAGSDGRVFVRRLNQASDQFLDTTWSYRANAYGSPPAMVVDAEGRIDVFGVSVDTASGHRSVLAHWSFTADAGWSAASLLVQSDTDFRQGLGLRAPVVGRDDQGHRVLAWTERTAVGAPQTLRAMRYSRFSAAWTAPADVSTPLRADGVQRAPTLAVNGSGRATAAWVEADSGGAERVRVARLR